MIVEHHMEKEVVKGEVDNPSFILTNKKGGFLFLSALNNISRFQGIYFLKTGKKWEIMKTIENISLVDVTPKKIVNQFYNIKRISGSVVERFFMNQSNSFVYNVDNFNGEAEIVLDCRKIYDYGDIGRIYKIKKEKDNLIIEYTKYTNPSLKRKNYKIYIVIKGVKDYSLVNNWQKRYYEYDNQRNSLPFELYVYRALRLSINKSANLVFSFSDKKTEAIKKANYLYENFQYIRKSQKNYVKNICHNNIKTNDNKLKIAYSCAVKSLNDLIQEIGNETGVYAGLPWFFQFWTRDEGISLKALLLNENYADEKKILVRHLKHLLPDGRLPSINKGYFLGPSLNSADGVGWMFKRLQDLIETLRRRKILNQYFKQKELLSLKTLLEHSIIKIEKHYMKNNGLIYNGPLETWMDSGFDVDTREGFRIEIQALYLNMLNFMKELSGITKDKKNYVKYAKLEKEMSKNVKNAFYDNGYLLDGIGDYKIRPNIFLAYYIYPKLLKRREWQKCFDNVLKKTWLKFGGLSSIDKNSYLFTENSTGEHKKSYHRGDSWFFINNMAALCMYKVNKRRYNRYIHKILKASKNEILFSGAIGHHSELSSASSLKSEGCLSQAWSSAMFIELVKEIYG